MYKKMPYVCIYVQSCIYMTHMYMCVYIYIYVPHVCIYTSYMWHLMHLFIYYMYTLKILRTRIFTLTGTDSEEISTM